MFVAAAQAWDTPSPLDKYCIVELTFWGDYPGNVYTRNVHLIGLLHLFQFIRMLAMLLMLVIFLRKIFSPIECSWMKNWCRVSAYRELAVIQLDALSTSLPSSWEKWFSDYQGMPRIVQVGGIHFDLHILASDFFSFCSNHGVSLEIDWIPGYLNKKADYLSKLVDYNDR